MFLKSVKSETAWVVGLTVPISAPPALPGMFAVNHMLPSGPRVIELGFPSETGIGIDVKA